MHPRLFYGLKCIKEGAANKFRGFKAPKKLWFSFLEDEQHRDRYDRQLYRFHNTKQSKSDVLKRCIKPR